MSDLSARHAARKVLLEDHIARQKKEINRFWRAFRRLPGYEIFSAVYLGASPDDGQMWSSSYPRDWDPVAKAGWNPSRLYNLLAQEGERNPALRPTVICAQALGPGQGRWLEFFASSEGFPLYRRGGGSTIPSDRARKAPINAANIQKWVAVREAATEALRTNWVVNFGQVIEVQIRTGWGPDEVDQYHRTLRGEGSLSDRYNLGTGKRARQKYDITTEMTYSHKTKKGKLARGFAKRDAAEGLTLYVVSSYRTGDIAEATPESIALAAQKGEVERQDLIARKAEMIERARRDEERRLRKRQNVTEAGKYSRPRYEL